MFTGIVTATGTVEAIEKGGVWRARIACPWKPGEIALGASIACSGACLTVVAKGARPAPWFAVDISQETLRKTTLGSWKKGTKLNLERALRVGDELGGHFVTGHVDAVAQVVARATEGESVVFTLKPPAQLAKFIAPKGSVALDGVSLTVNTVEKGAFRVNIIPHTLAATTLGAWKKGSNVNMEVDLIARYLARLHG